MGDDADRAALRAAARKSHEANAENQYPKWNEHTDSQYKLLKRRHENQKAYKSDSLEHYLIFTFFPELKKHQSVEAICKAKKRAAQSETGTSPRSPRSGPRAAAIPAAAAIAAAATIPGAAAAQPAAAAAGDAASRRAVSELFSILHLGKIYSISALWRVQDKLDPCRPGADGYCEAARRKSIGQHQSVHERDVRAGRASSSI